ncbi:cerebellar degeneration-related protein 2-like [Haliotis asinina]|uniref:cerebellar degeneration-related protein 2-like n=1 Tax=Haliotis asinina TaxID=109174 RepID=UPI0035318BBE
MEACETFETDDVLEDEWYENDLQLAAELGKALLERNRELEAQVVALHQTNHEQALEVQFYAKQLETVRLTNESRMRVYEDLDRSSQELEKTNQKLLTQSKSDKEKIDRLSNTVELLDLRVEDLLKKVDEMKAAERLTKKQESRRALSLASLNETAEAKKGYYLENLSWTYNEKLKNLPMNPYEQEIRRLQETVQHVKSLKSIEKHKREDVELENSIVIQENQILERRIATLEERVSQIKSLEEELAEANDRCAKILCWNCDRSVEDVESQYHILKEIEHDHPELKTPGKAVKLGGGGSLYGSSESISKVAVDATEILEKDADDSGLSILDELETQYKNLFQKYEAVIKAKRQSGESEETAEERMRKRLANKEVQTLLNLTFTKDYTQDTGQPAPYKVLFKELFATLRKSRIEEAAEKSPPGSSSSSSPDGSDDKNTQTFL